MIHKVEVIIPNELIKEIEVYAKVEGITLNEFLLWALGEKVANCVNGEGLRTYFGLFQTKLLKKLP